MNSWNAGSNHFSTSIFFHISLMVPYRKALSSIATIQSIRCHLILFFGAYERHVQRCIEYDKRMLRLVTSFVQHCLLPLLALVVQPPCVCPDMHAMVQLLRENKVRAIEVSNYTIQGLQEILQDSDVVMPAVNQVEFHPFLYQKDLL
jgi:hypothetical protein